MSGPGCASAGFPIYARWTCGDNGGSGLSIGRLFLAEPKLDLSQIVAGQVAGLPRVVISFVSTTAFGTKR
jgi:hypothetical protein